MKNSLRPGTRATITKKKAKKAVKSAKKVRAKKAKVAKKAWTRGGPEWSRVLGHFGATIEQE